MSLWGRSYSKDHSWLQDFCFGGLASGALGLVIALQQAGNGAFQSLLLSTLSSHSCERN